MYNLSYLKITEKYSYALDYAGEYCVMIEMMCIPSMLSGISVNRSRGGQCCSR